MALFSKGLIYKKLFNKDGTVSDKVPFFIKTLAKLVYTSDGKTVEDKITSLENKKTYVTYDTLDDYNAAYEAGEIPEGVLVVVKNDR